MLSWLFKKRGGVGAPTAAPSPQAAAQPPRAVELQAHSKAKPAEDTSALWLPQLESARGDDAALLRIVQAAPVLEIKLAAVEALTGEDTLKQAERELRGHDRRVHRTAKRRLEAAVAQREARTRAQALIASAAALAGVSPVPANRLVALDRDWQALDPALLDPAQVRGFSDLRDRLNTAVREHGEQQQLLRRWTADATQALSDLKTRCREAAAHGGADDVAAYREAAQALRASRPDALAAFELDAALQAALHSATQLELRLAWLAALGSCAETAPATADALTPQQAWHDFAPLPDPELADLLNQRFEQWQQAHAPARPAAKEPPPAPPAGPPLPSAEQRQHLGTLLGQAEAALADGQLGVMQQHLQAIDAALEPLDGVMPGEKLRSRHQALLAERGRLKGWQQWGGGRARDDLTAEAEELARITLAAAAPDTPDAPKLHLKAHGEAIQALRKRWKELDRLGAPASQALWQRFDAALQAAHQPVAAQQAALKAAREENLSARETLLATLDALPTEPASPADEDVTAHWKERSRALDRFHTAWRQLGPIEHTVPAAARSALQQRLRDSVARIEAPLQEARRAAEARREQLIVRAEALLQELREHPQMRDALPRLRELQAEWQQHALALPLARAAENALWTRFKAATDALFAQREAAFSARDAELAAKLAAREALLARLSALTRDTPVAEIERALGEADRAWRQAVELPRGTAAAVDARFREARAAALQCLSSQAQQRWQADIDTLAAKLALCEERESATAGDDADLAARWAAQGALPAPWEQALAQRWSQPAGPGPLPEAAFDELLLQLEAALELPATPQWQAARRELKLRALKDTLEGRASAPSGPARQAEWLAAALRQRGATAPQRERLHALLAALRHAAPGSLLAPARG
jgi:hypothetical protein